MHNLIKLIYIKREIDGYFGVNLFVYKVLIYFVNLISEEKFYYSVKH